MANSKTTFSTAACVRNSTKQLRAAEMCFDAIVNRFLKSLNDRIMERETHAITEMKEKCEKEAKEMLKELEEKYLCYLKELEDKVGQGKQTVEDLKQEIEKLKDSKNEAEEKVNALLDELDKVEKATEKVQKGKILGKSGFLSGFM